MISTSKKPQDQLFYLLLLIMGGFMLAILLTSLVMQFIPGSDNIQALMQNPSFIKTNQLIQVFCLMFAPSLIFLKFVGYENDSQIFQVPRKISLYLLSALAIVVSLPFNDWLTQLNQSMHLPAFMQGVETWMHQKETEISDLTRIFLTGDSVKDIVINLCIMVAIPAFCEELLFRGVLQQKLVQWWKKPYWAIVATAFIFSAIHMQFLTFLPRFVLGIAMGVLMYEGKSIWLPITAHFTNNLLALGTFYYIKFYHPEIDPFSQDVTFKSAIGAAVSALLLISLLVIFKRQSVTSTATTQE